MNEQINKSYNQSESLQMKIDIQYHMTRNRNNLQSILFLILLPILSSSTLYSVSPDYEITFDKSYQQLAHAIYRERGYQTGWNYLHVYASPTASLIDQHRGAGFLEGYATFKQIYYAYRNYVDKFLKGTRANIQIETFITKQIQFLDKLSENSQNDIYRSYISAKMEQIRYMYRGYLKRINEQNLLSYHIPFSQFYYLTMVGDLRTLLKAYTNEFPLKQGRQCSAYIKLQNNELTIAHSTMNPYEFMIRIMKSYYFPSRDPRVGSQSIIFSSRPGDLNSKDDFYIMSNGMKVMETSLANYNEQNYQTLSPLTVPCWLRGVVASHLAKNLGQWTDYFSRFHSGTHNNQWLIADSKQIKDLKDIVWFVEEAFDLIVVTDLTDKLLSNGYVASFNTPYSKAIFDKLDWEKGIFDCIIAPYNFQSEPRNRILKQYDKLMIDEESMKKWLLTNQQQDPKEGLAPRQDMATDNPDAFGLTDTKIFSPQTQKQNFIWVISGPSTSNGRFPVFDWKNWDTRPHLGMPSLFNFTWEKSYLDYEKQPTSSLQRE